MWTSTIKPPYGWPLRGGTRKPIAAWLLNDGAGTVARDYTGNGHHGTLADLNPVAPQVVSACTDTGYRGTYTANGSYNSKAAWRLDSSHHLYFLEGFNVWCLGPYQGADPYMMQDAPYYVSILSNTPPTSGWSATNGTDTPPTLAAGTAPLGPWFGDNLHWAGGAGYVDISTNSVFSFSTSLSILARIWVDSFSTVSSDYYIRGVVEKTDPYNGYFLRVGDGSSGGSNTVRGGMNIGGWQELSGPAIITGAWHDIALTYDGATLSVYADGVGNSSSLSGSISNSSNSLRIGTDQRGRNFAGIIGSVEIFDVPLSATEVVAYAKRPFQDWQGQRSNRIWLMDVGQSAFYLTVSDAVGAVGVTGHGVAVTHADEVAAAVSLPRGISTILSEAIGTADVAGRGIAAVHSEALNSSVAAGLGIGVTFTDKAGASVANPFGAGITLPETVATASEAGIDVAKLLTEYPTVAAAFKASVTATLAEVIATSATVGADLSVLLSEVLTAADEVLTSTARTLEILENLTAADTVNVGAAVSFLESPTMQALLSRAVGLALQEALSLADTTGRATAATQDAAIAVNATRTSAVALALSDIANTSALLGMQVQATVADQATITEAHERLPGLVFLQALLTADSHGAAVAAGHQEAINTGALASLGAELQVADGATLAASLNFEAALELLEQIVTEDEVGRAVAALLADQIIGEAGLVIGNTTYLLIEDLITAKDVSERTALLQFAEAIGISSALQKIIGLTLTELLAVHAERQLPGPASYTILSLLLGRDVLNAALGRDVISATQARDILNIKGGE